MKKLIASSLVFAYVVGMSNGLTYASNFEPYDFDYKNADITMTKTDERSNGIFTINNCNASKLFNFKFNLNPGESLVTARDYLGEEFDTGEVFVVDENNIIKQVIDKPWAFDSAGIEVPTYFNASENMLTQTVNHTCDNTFPITADPDAWQVTVCIASISAVLLSVSTPLSSVRAIKNGIKIAGGLSIFAQMLIGILTQKVTLSNLSAFKPELGVAVGLILGIDGVITNCRW